MIFCPYGNGPNRQVYSKYIVSVLFITYGLEGIATQM